MTTSRRRRRTAEAADARPVTPWPWRARRCLPALALVALVLAAYGNSCRAGFALDSKGLVLQDPRVRTATRENVELILDHTYWWPYGESGLYRPATTLSYLLNFAVLGDGDQPAGYHRINVLLHAVNVLLLYLLAGRLLGDRRSAGFVAAVWAVHPVLTESVTNIVGRADLLASTAVLGGLLMYLESRSATGWRRTGWLVGLAGITTIGVFSKESAVVIVGAIGLFEVAWWRPGRSASHLALACVALAPPLVAMGLQRAAVLAAAGPAVFPFTANPIVGAEFWTGRLTAIAVMGRSLWLLAWPATLSADYSYAAIPLATGSAVDWFAWLTVGLAAGVVAAAFWWNRQAFFWGAFALVAFLPTSNLVVTIGSIMAERFLYLPSIGVVACVVPGVLAVAKHYRVTGVALVVLGAMVVGFGARTVIRNADWHDDVTLAAATVRAVPASYKSHRMLAGALYDADREHARIDEAIAEATRAIAILDPLPDSNNDGEMYLQAGGYQIEKAEQAWRRGEPDLPSVVALNHRQPYLSAIPLLRRAEAIGQAQRAARPDQGFAPHYANVYRLLSVALLRVGDVQPALDAAERAREIAPLEPEVYARVAEASLAADRPHAAAIALTEGLMITASQPFAEALVGLYRAGLDPDGCAVLGAGVGTTFNPRCPTVQRHVCAAAAEAIPMLRLANQPEVAESINATAVGSFGCAAGRPGTVEGR